MEKNKKENVDNAHKKPAEERPFRYKHARANIAVDMVVFGIIPNDNKLYVFIQRDKIEDKWSLPGRFMHCGSDPNDEIAPDDNWTLEQTRESALHMTWPIKTILHDVVLKPSEEYTIKQNDDLICQLEAMSIVDRDSREARTRVVSIPYMTLVRIEKDEMPSKQLNNDDASVAQWIPLSELINKDGTCGKIELDHDHLQILSNGVKRLFQEIRTRPIGLGMLPLEFDLSDLIHIYSVVLTTMGAPVERSNLRKLLLERGVIKEVRNENPSKKGGGTYQFIVEKYCEYKRYLNFSLNPKPKTEK